MQRSTPDIHSVEHFADLAEAYCALIERYSVYRPDDFLAAVQPAIAALYTAGLALPPLPEPEDADTTGDDEDQSAPSWLQQSVDVPSDPDDMSHGNWRPLYKSLSAYLGSRNYYRELFDPYAPMSEKEVTGSLADDLSDIYRDLLSGCRKWQRGERVTAHWEWRFELENHWGEHATGALRAIHCLAAWHELPWPRSEGIV
jgi:uncharacterized protein DUF5063